MKKRLLLSVSILIVMLLVPATVILLRPKKTEPAPELVLLYAENQPEDYPTTLGAQYFSDLVLERTDGRIKILVKADAQLGAESQVLKQLTFGGVAFARVSLSQIAEIVPTLNVLQLPYIYRDSTHMWNVLDGEIGESFFQEIYEGDDYVALSWYDAGSRNFYSVTPITCLEDFQGLKIRVQESDMMADMVQSLGATPVKTAYSEVYSSIQKNVVQGAENNWPSYVSMRHSEVAGFVTEDEHTRIPEMQICSKVIWDELSEADQEIIRECAIESATYERQLWSEREQEARKTAIDSGIEVIELSAEEKERFRQCMDDLYYKYCSEYMDVIEKISEE